MIIDQNRVTPQVITSLKENEIFVFGSCLSGVHRDGDAKLALEFGALQDHAVGLVGNTYAIPVRHKNYKTLISLDDLKKYINDLFKFAKRKSDLVFIVNDVGCNKYEYKNSDIAPLFRDFVQLNNVYLPIQWWRILSKNDN